VKSENAIHCALIHLSNPWDPKQLSMEGGHLVLAITNSMKRQVANEIVGETERCVSW